MTRFASSALADTASMPGSLASAQATRNTITLRGSAQLVTEFFGYAVSRSERFWHKTSLHACLLRMCLLEDLLDCTCNSILYQRGIYPPESFEQHRKYGLSVMISADPGLVQYMNGVLPQMSGGLSGPAIPAFLKACFSALTSQSCRVASAR